MAAATVILSRHAPPPGVEFSQFSSGGIPGVELTEFDPEGSPGIEFNQFSSGDPPGLNRSNKLNNFD